VKKADVKTSSTFENGVEEQSGTTGNGSGSQTASFEDWQVGKGDCGQSPSE